MKAGSGQEQEMLLSPFLAEMGELGRDHQTRVSFAEPSLFLYVLLGGVVVKPCSLDSGQLLVTAAPESAELRPRAPGSLLKSC